MNPFDSYFWIYIALCCACFAAWITHVVTCILAQEWILMVVGALLAPVGIVHGVMIWMGVV